MISKKNVLTEGKIKEAYNNIDDIARTYTNEPNNFDDIEFLWLLMTAKHHLTNLLTHYEKK